MRRAENVCSILFGLSAVTVCPIAAHAQSAGEVSAAQEKPSSAGGELSEVIVTARKRDERLIDVPVTVTALSGATLETYQLADIESVAAHVPSLIVSSGGSGAGGQITLRGVGSSGLSGAFDSAILLDIDGIQISTMRLLQNSFVNDAAQIEVMKGPQSLYFGKSASAGVISVQSANPTDTFTGSGTAAYDFVQQGVTAQGFVAGPITDTLGFRVAVRGVDTEHVVENLVPNVAHHWRGDNTIDVRTTLQWHPLQQLTANLKAGYNHYRDNGPATYVTDTCGADGKPDPVSFGGLTLAAGYNCSNALSGKIFVSDPAAVYAARGPLGSGLIPFSTSDVYYGRLKVDLNLTDRLLLSSVSGAVYYAAADNESYTYGGVAPPGGLDGVAAGDSFGGGEGNTKNTLHQYSQELRLASSGAGLFNFMLGAFYEHRTMGFATDQTAVGVATLAPLLGFPTGPNGADPSTGYTYDWEKVHATKSDAYSGFGSISLDLTERLQVSGGTRWTKQNVSSNINVPYMSAFLSDALGFVPSGFNSGPIRFKDSNWSPEATIRYKVEDDVNLYAAFKTGFKSGGVDNSALPSNGLFGFSSPDPAVRAATAAGLIFKSEEARGAEAGIKARLADRTVFLNGSIYRYVYKDLQVQNFNGTTIQFVTTNAGQVTSRGADLDFDWRTPVTGLQLGGSLAYTDTKFTKSYIPDPVTAPTVDLNGRTAANAPKFSGNLSPRYTQPVGSLRLEIAANVRFTGSYSTGNLNYRDYVQGGYFTYDSNVSIGSPDQRWKVSLIGVNLGDKIYVTRTTGTRPFGIDDQALLLNSDRRRVMLQASTSF
jgi:iron complex outermembrane receptor protein